MSESILQNVKHQLGISPDYTAFDDSIIIHINSAFASAESLGATISANFFIEDQDAEWSDLGVDTQQTNLLKTYVYLKVRMLFDPPTSSYLINASEKQLAEIEFRIHVLGKARA